jgi:L-ascorbate metabolism protein UlaG (beta-lactamase superfamily)
MKHFKTNFLVLAVTLMFISNAGFGQANEIKVKFIGNCGLYLTDGNLNVYVDFPYKSGAFNYMTYEQSELDSIKDNAIHLFTHRHPDHYSKKLVKRLKGKVYGPWKVAKKRRLDSKKLNDSVNAFYVQTFKTKHRFSFKHDSYLITWHGKRIFLSGDTERADMIATIKDMDWAFVPYWILLDAKEKNMKIDTEKFGIYHLYPNQKMNVLTSEKIILMEKQKEIILIPY